MESRQDRIARREAQTADAAGWLAAHADALEGTVATDDVIEQGGAEVTLVGDARHLDTDISADFEEQAQAEAAAIAISNIVG